VGKVWEGEGLGKEGRGVREKAFRRSSDVSIERNYGDVLASH